MVKVPMLMPSLTMKMIFFASPDDPVPVSARRLRLVNMPVPSAREARALFFRKSRRPKEARGAGSGAVDFFMPRGFGVPKMCPRRRKSKELPSCDGAVGVVLNIFYV